MKLHGNDGSEAGAVIIVTLMILTILSMSSLMAVNMAVSDSRIMRNSRSYHCSLYRAETGITLAGEKHATSWLDPDSDLFDLSLDDAAFAVDNFCLVGIDGKDTPVMGGFKIGRIEKVPAARTLSDRFNHLGHRAPMPVGSGFSAMNFEIRRYGILSTGTYPQGKSNVTVEAGLYKIFNRF